MSTFENVTIVKAAYKLNVSEKVKREILAATCHLHQPIMAQGLALARAAPSVRAAQLFSPASMPRCRAIRH